MTPSPTPESECIAQPQRIARRVLVLLAAVLGLSLLLRVHHIVDAGFSFDESCSAKISTFPWGEMFDAISRDAHPPVYYMVLKGWGGAFGDNPTVLRGLSVIFGLATIAAAFWFVREALSGIRAQEHQCSSRDRDLAAVLAALLVGTSALQVAMSVEARSYSLGAFLTVTSAGFLLRAVRPSSSQVDWGLFAIAAALLSLTHYYGLFTVAAQLLFAATVVVGEAWRRGLDARTRKLLAGFALSAWAIQLVWIVWAPVFQFQRERANRQLWMPPLDWDGFSRVAWETLAGEDTWTSAGFGAGVLAVAIWAHSVFALVAFGGRAGRLIGLCAGVPLLGCVLYDWSARNILGARYLSFAQVCLLLGWTLIISRMPHRIARMTVFGVLLAWQGLGCWRFHESREFQASFPGVKGAVAHLNRVRQPNDPVIVASAFAHPIVQQYADQKTRIFARYDGDPRRDLLAGPPLRAAERLSATEIASMRAERIWAIDIGGGLGGAWRVPVPDGFRLATEEGFSDCTQPGRQKILVREYVRDGTRR